MTQNKPRNVRGGHVYTFGGHNYPSVTTVLSRTESEDDHAYLEKWRKTYCDPEFKDADDYTDYTSMRGTFVHYNVLNNTAGVVLDPSELPPISRWFHRRERLIKEIQTSVGLWKKLELDIRRPISAETAIYHNEKRYAGTPDLQARIDREKTILDIKTSSGVREHHLLQLGAYIQIENHLNPRTPVQRGMLVYLHPKFKDAVICEITGKEIHEQINLFNDRLLQFWKIPGVKKEYGLL